MTITAIAIKEPSLEKQLCSILSNVLDKQDLLKTQFELLERENSLLKHQNTELKKQLEEKGKTK